ncbi:MAG: polyphosphate kinase 1 [Solobacterium sp.]|jgi:polyphosphate kinase|nr:polyphosphate kinase 1 [Solobacterium sp.]MCH4205676.1 polyphosphate kinase 1 [Solobacterium sp.]MCH4227200.1 polyphosphate kinase 1 [Solobacterium sp.]MCH4282506.1 polyphosphate kinase 1 [Solobacterium sp.]
MIKDLYKEGYTQNRELSWLGFDDRVLQEANAPEVPLLERLKFISIYASNLNEFFMIRVGSLTQVKQIKIDQIDNKSGLTAAEQLKLIYKAVGTSIRKRDHIYQKVLKEAAKKGIICLSLNDCSKRELKHLNKYFDAKIKPLLSPQIVDLYHPFPNLRNGAVEVAGMAMKKGQTVFAVVTIPSTLSSVIALPSDGKAKIRYVHMEDLIQYAFPRLFPGFKIKDTAKIVVMRNEDVNADDDAFDDIVDYRKKMRKVLNQRQHLSPVALFASAHMSSEMKKYLLQHLGLEAKQMYVTSYPLDARFGFELPEMFDEADEDLFPPYAPKLSASLNYHQKLFPQICRHDVLLSYPYESMEPLLLLVKEAADDPSVVSIKITIYRLAKQAKLVEYLCRAAENGKEVVTLIELKARFDEQVNIDYSQRLEEAGCTVLYGFSEYKVHSKILLITRSVKNRIQQVAQIATGNFNEKTAKQYTDLAYFTADSGIVKDAEAFFRNMMVGKLDGHYRHLLVAPVSLKSSLLQMIDREIAKKEKGRILIKINSITDEELIAKLSQASQAGVQIQMIVRGICCLIPQIKGKTENIEIRSIVGRYLEHSRIYLFGTARSEKMYISSADFMTRNTEKRVEIACPIMDTEIRRRIDSYLQLCLEDTVKARRVGKDGKYHRIASDQSIDSQDWMMQETKGSHQHLQASDGRQAKVIGVFHTTYSPKKKNKKA